MTKVTLLGPWVRRFLLEYLVSERNLARNTQRSYRDTLCLLLPFVARHASKEIDEISVMDISPDAVRLFLRHLEESRKCARADERRQCLPSHPKRKRQPVVQPELVLPIHTRLDRMRMHVRSGLRYIRFGWQPQQQIGEGVPRENALVERECAEIIRPSEALQVHISHAPRVHPEFHRVPALDARQVVGELNGLRFRRSIFVPSDGRIVPRIITKIENRERTHVAMISEIKACQSER